MWLVLRKEIIELLRDRKTLFFMIAMPMLVIPAIFGITSYFTGKVVQKAQSKVLNYSIQGAEYAPELVARFKALEDFQWVALDSDAEIEQSIQAEQVDFVLVIPEQYSNELLSAGQITLTLYLNDASVNFVSTRVETLIDAQAKDNQALAFEGLSLTELQQTALIEPIKLQIQDISDKRENWGEKIGGFIPYLLLFSCLMGCLPVATDIGAGEKERGTLETLLLAPLSRTQLVLGKFMTIAFAGVVSALVTVSSILIWGVIIGQAMAIQFVADFMGQIGMVDFVLMFFMLVPVVAIFSAVLLSLSIYARSYKEAQSYSSFLPIFVVVPIVIAFLPGIRLQDGWAWVPLTNVALAIKELVKGTMDYIQLLAIFGSTLVIAGGLIYFCVFWFNREKVLFR